MHYQTKLELMKNLANIKLLNIILKKESNLVVSLDLTKKKEFLELAEIIAPYVCMIKTHIDILEDFDWDFIEKLQALSKKYQFAIFEDRKFADIGNTAKLQYEKGIYRISDWADFTNAHLVSGPGIISALSQVGLPKGRSLLLLAQMSSKDNLITPEYTQKNVEYAIQYSDFVGGFISQQKLTDAPNLLHFTPGVQINASSDAFDQQYISPEKAFLENQTDIVIVGRGIYQAAEPEQQAKLYQQCCWESYCEANK